jgi:hypothetical protein
VDFFAKLLALQDGPQPPKFLSSHPATADRISDVTDQIEQRYGAAVDPGVTQRYDCIGTSLTLEQLKAHISSGQIAIEPGTGPQP